MQFPTRPQIPNPYQIAGHAVQQVGGQVQEYGKDRDELADRFRLMMEKRAQAEIENRRYEEKAAMEKADADRKAKDYEAKAKRDADRQKFFARKPGAEGASAYTVPELQNALATGLIDAAEMKALQPREPDRFAAGGGYYEMGPDGSPRQLVAPPPREEKPPRGQVVQDANGNFVVVDPTTGTSAPVTGADGKPVAGKGPTTLTGKQLENAKGKLLAIQVLRKQLANLQKAFDETKGLQAGPLTGKLPTPDNRKFEAAKAALYTTVRQLSRTPGEGSMSDYESRLSTAQLPDLGDYESATQQKIDQLADLANTIEQGYTGMIPQGQTGGAPKEGDTKVNSKGRKVIFRNGGWVPL